MTKRIRLDQQIELAAGADFIPVSDATGALSYQLKSSISEDTLQTVYDRGDTINIGANGTVNLNSNGNNSILRVTSDATNQSMVKWLSSGAFTATGLNAAWVMRLNDAGSTGTGQYIQHNGTGYAQDTLHQGATGWGVNWSRAGNSANDVYMLRLGATNAGTGDAVGFDLTGLTTGGYVFEYPDVFDIPIKLGGVAHFLQLTEAETETQGATGNVDPKTEVEFVDATAGNTVRTLPTPVAGARNTYTLSRYDNSTNTVTIDSAGGETFSGAANLSLGVGQTAKVIWKADTSEWQVLQQPISGDYIFTDFIYYVEAAGGVITTYYDQTCTDIGTPVTTNVVPANILSLLPAGGFGCPGTFVQYRYEELAADTFGAELIQDQDYSNYVGGAPTTTTGPALGPDWLTNHTHETNALWNDAQPGVYHVATGPPNGHHTWNGAWSLTDFTTFAGFDAQYVLANMPADGASGNLTLGQNINFPNPGVYRFEISYANPVMFVGIEPAYTINLGGTVSSTAGSQVLGNLGPVPDDQLEHTETIDVYIDTAGTQLLGIYQSSIGAAGNDVTIGRISVREVTSGKRVIGEYSVGVNNILSKGKKYMLMDSGTGAIAGSEVYHDKNDDDVDIGTLTLGNITDSGTGTIATGTTSVTINHDLGVTPSSVNLSYTDRGGTTTTEEIAMSDTSFTVTVNAVPTSDVQFRWRVEVDV